MDLAFSKEDLAFRDEVRAFIEEAFDFDSDFPKKLLTKQIKSKKKPAVAERVRLTRSARRRPAKCPLFHSPPAFKLQVKILIYRKRTTGCAR